MKFSRITSIANPRIKDTLNIMKKRRKYGPAAIPIEGIHLIETALNAGASIDNAFVTESLMEREEGKKILEMIRTKRDSVFEVSDSVMARLTETESPQGIVAVVSYKPLRMEEVEMSRLPLVTVVDGVQDPGNLGTIIRASDAAGADAVVLLPGTCDPYMPKTLRASAGSVFNIPVVGADPATLMKSLKDRSVNLAVTAVDAADTLYDADLGQPIAFVFGNEAHGVSRRLREAADFNVRIPIYGRAESLNVGSASAVCLYEAVRQRIGAARK